MHAHTPSPPLLGAAMDTLATDVYAGLTRSPQKELPSKYLYDSIGSALFELITQLPEYGLTRAEERILQTHADAMLARLGPVDTVAELGSGSGRKTRYLLEACARRNPATYFPIEISATALAQCQRELGDIDSVAIVGLEREYLQGLQDVVTQRHTPGPLLVLFLGSTLGNFERSAARRFLGQMRSLLRAGDGLLLGTDLHKPTPQVIAAYDDPLGITAAFNLNLLLRLNRELGAHFDLRRFCHEARFNEQTQAIEMHIRSLETQTIDVPGAGLSVTLQAGETIWTEASHKYHADEILSLGQQTGFVNGGQWVDERWPFADTLLIAH